MISGRFGDNGELYFEIVLITVDGEELLIEGLLDTGFTMGFLAVNEQDLYALGWPLLYPQIKMTTAKGDDFFNIYEGKVILDQQEYIIPVHGSENIPDILIGTQWLDFMELVVNKPRGILTLERQAGETC